MSYQTEPCPKQKYLDKFTAYAVGKGLARKYRDEGREHPLWVYRCQICKYWHLTSKKNNRNFGYVYIDD